MTRVATMTVVRGEGECQAIINGVVQRELERLQEIDKRQLEMERREIRAEMNVLRGECGAVRMRRDRMLAEKMEEIDERVSRRRNCVTYTVGMAWSVLCATVMSINCRIHGRVL